MTRGVVIVDIDGMEDGSDVIESRPQNAEIQVDIHHVEEEE